VTVLVSDTPATQWVEAFPVGNGRLGAMVHGGARAALVQVNDATAWSGSPAGPDAALDAVLAGGAGPSRLADVRAAIADERWADAEAALATFRGTYTQAFQPFVDLVVDVAGDADDYERALDLRDGVLAERWDGVEVEWFASAPDGCLHGRWTGPSLDLRLTVSTLHEVVSQEGGVLVLRLPDDVAPNHEPDAPGVTRTPDGPALHGVAVLLVRTDGALDDGTVTGATWVEAVLTTATTSTWPTADPLRPVDEAVAEALAAARAALPGDREDGATRLATHVADHRALADRTTLTLGAEQRFAVPVSADDPTAAAQAAFTFGRYLLMASSRPGSPPAHLQGLWNDQLRPPWSSNYTLNINLEMAYWAAEAVGLSECQEPLVDHIGLLAQRGTRVATELYGCRGWVAHHNSDVWGWALPVGGLTGDPSWADWAMGGVWLSRHLTGRGPALDGAVQFCLDWVVPDGDALTTTPSTSPENAFRTPTGSRALSSGSTMDLALIRDLFERYLALTPDAAVADALQRLPRPSVAPDGTLREWSHDADPVDPHHRHLSHLVGLYPLAQIDPETTPDLAAAAARTLDARGPGSTGWSLAWKAALRARLGDGAAVGALLGEAVRPARDDGPFAGGLLPNLFSTHPPFQVDGNLGLVAAVTEALVQSHTDDLRILPALPPGWPDGELRGLRARGGFAVDVSWSDGLLREVVLHPSTDGEVTVVHQNERRAVHLVAGTPVRLEGWVG
jgi:alpha-L-fucosidase 2